MSKDAFEAVTIRPPRRGEVYQFAGTGSTQVFAVPLAWKGLKVRFEAVGDTFTILTAPDATIAIDMTQKTTIGGGPGYVLPAASVAVGDTLAAGQYKEYDFTVDDAFVGFRGTGTSGTLLVRQAETAMGSS